MHFSGEKAVFEAGRSKNPNFRGVKREGEKLVLDEIELIIAEMEVLLRANGTYLQDFGIKVSKKMNANFVSKLAFRGGSPSRARTYNNSVNSRVLYH